ncbi:hypothetical protein BDR07DRAFT_1379004 [Suillus spraguei]|nr:hypothetical protein BDR07DRAFT_1379004 [Suillus spraguei]
MCQAGITINIQVPCMLLKNFMPCTSSTGSSITSGSLSTRSFKSLSVSLPSTSEAPDSSPISKSRSLSLRASSPVTPSKYIIQLLLFMCYIKKNSSVSPPSTSEVLDSSPIVKSHNSSYLRTGLPVTPVKTRVSTVELQVPAYKAPTSSPILGSSSPIPSSLPVTPVKTRVPTVGLQAPTYKAPTSSPILGSSSPIPSSLPVTPVKTRVPTVGLQAPTYKAPTSSPILGSSSPIPSSSPMLRGSSPTNGVSLLSTTMLDECNPTMANTYDSHKRPHQYTMMPPDGLADHENFPMKKPRLLLTMTFAARMEYQHLHTEELELIMSLMRDEMEESQAYLSRADLQIGSLWNSLHDAGMAVIWNKGRKDAKKEIENGRLFPSHADHEVDDNGDSCNSSVSS